MNNSPSVTEKMLDSLRASLIEKNKCGEMSDKRLRHTLEVEKMAERLGEIYAPEKLTYLRAAALLHDITKERSFDEQIKLCAEYDIELGEVEYYAGKTLHAMTGAALIPKIYPEFDIREITESHRKGKFLTSVFTPPNSSLAYTRYWLASII